MTNEQFKSLLRFIEAGATLKESLENYFLLKAGNGKDLLVCVASNGVSTIWELTFQTYIDAEGEPFRVEKK